MCEEIFAESSYNFKLSKTKGLKVKGSFDHTVLEECISKTIAEHSASCQDITQARKIPLNDSSEHSDHTEGFQCRVFVCATKKAAALTTARFRSYESPGRDQFTGCATIVQASRATSAATSFFEPTEIDGFSYVDGATGANNPSQEAWDELRDLFKPRTDNIENMISCFISIGCGNPGIQTIDDGLKGLLTESIVNIATETEKTAKRFQKDHGEMFRRNRCFRFNVEHGLEHVGLEEWKKLDVIKNAVDEYLQEENTGDKMESAKERLLQKACMEIEDYA